MQASEKRPICHYGYNLSSDSSHVFVSDSEKGFSVLELVAVVTVLGILSSLTIPRIGNIISSSRVDKAKALLNTAAADCLQNSRIKVDNKNTIDDTIISDVNLNPIGFAIDKPNNADKCSYFQIVPTDKDDTIRFPIGFSVIDGALSKFAKPTSTNKGTINACKSWAGVNCKQDEGLKELVEWKNSIASAKAICEKNYGKWLSENNTQPLQFKRWNPNADVGCPARPAQDGSTSYKTDPTCTTNGCNRVVFGLDGKFVGFTREDYDRALEAKYGKACTEWVASKKLANYTNKPQNQAAELKECGLQKFWFYKGIDAGTKEEFDKRICSDNLEIQKKTPGKRTVEGCGSQTYYFCNNQIKASEKDYKECSCDFEKYDKAQEGKNGAFTTTEQGANGCGNYWICKTDILNNEEDYKSKCKKSCTPDPQYCAKPRFIKHESCATYRGCLKGG